MYFENNSPDLMFTIIPIIIFCGFVFVITIFIFTAVKGIGQWQSNNKQPILIVPAQLITKRIDVSSHMHNDGDGIGHSTSSSTTYYITFQVESGSRMEFHVNGQEYGMLVEGDHGQLKFQGTRYLGFERN